MPDNYADFALTKNHLRDFSSATRGHFALAYGEKEKRGQKPCWPPFRKGKKFNSSHSQ